MADLSFFFEAYLIIDAITLMRSSSPRASASYDNARYVEDAIKAGPEAFRISAYRDAGLV